MSDVVDNLNALHKEVFADGVPDLIPSSTKLQEAIKFNKKKELGLKYVQSVRLAYPSGFTHALGDGTAGAFALNDATSGNVSRAEVTAAQILLKDQMDYETAAKASSAGPKAFKEGSKFFYEGMQKAMRKRIETELFYGSKGLGTVGTYTSGDPSIVVTTAEWAPGIWAGLEGTYIDVQTVLTSTVRGTVSITKVDIENKKIWLSGTVSGCTAGDMLCFKGAYATEMAGVHKILTNTGSLFNIDAGVYSLWKSSSKALSSAALSFNGIKSAVALAVGKGLDEEINLYVNPSGWDNVMSDIAALRRTDKSETKKVEVGAEEIVFHSQNGKISIIPSIFVKEGYAYGLCTPYWERIGAADVTFGTPGFGQDMFRQIDGKAGVEARAYSHQAIFSSAPAKNFIISGIVNS